MWLSCFLVSQSTSGLTIPAQHSVLEHRAHRRLHSFVWWCFAGQAIQEGMRQVAEQHSPAQRPFNSANVQSRQRLIPWMLPVVRASSSETLGDGSAANTLVTSSRKTLHNRNAADIDSISHLIDATVHTVDWRGRSDVGVALSCSGPQHPPCRRGRHASPHDVSPARAFI